MYIKIKDMIIDGIKRGGRKISFSSLLSKIDSIIDDHDALHKYHARYNRSRRDCIKIHNPVDLPIWKDKIIPSLCKMYMIRRCIIRTNPKNGTTSILINYKIHLIKTEG